MAKKLPATFVDLKSLVRIHLKQILEIDRLTTKVPMNAVALLIVIAYEALSKYKHRRQGPEYLFAQEYHSRHGVPLSIGAAIFDALRNGLAHRYDPYPIVVEGIGEVRFELAWKDCAPYHLRGIAVEIVNGHQRARPFPKGSKELPRALCLNVESMWHDLDDLFSRYEMTLMADPALASRFQGNVSKNRLEFTRKAEGNEGRQWHDFLASRRLEDLK